MACTPNFDQWSKQATSNSDQISLALMDAASMMPLCQWVSNVRAAEDSRANMDIAGYRLSEPQNSPRAYAIRTGHSIRLQLSSAYPVLPYVGLLSNGCSATGPFAVKEGKMFMLGIASLLLFVPLFFLFLFLCLSLLS